MLKNNEKSPWDYWSSWYSKSVNLFSSVSSFLCIGSVLLIFLFFFLICFVIIFHPSKPLQFFLFCILSFLIFLFFLICLVQNKICQINLSLQWFQWVKMKMRQIKKKKNKPNIQKRKNCNGLDGWKMKMRQIKKKKKTKNN